MQPRSFVPNVELVLFPGLDGTGSLFGPLTRVIPSYHTVRVISYPPGRPLSYDELFVWIEGELATTGPIVLIAESFSGPLAVRYAAEHPDRVRAVVLSATFVKSPAPGWLKMLVWPILFRFRPPRALVRATVMDASAPDSLADLVRGAKELVDARVLALRLREVLKVNWEEALRRCTVPILYLRPTRDRLVRRLTLQSLRSIRPDMVIREIEGPHALLQRNPEESWQAIAAFLARLEAK